jgi:hypothetical protein
LSGQPCYADDGSCVGSIGIEGAPKPRAMRSTASALRAADLTK